MAAFPAFFARPDRSLPCLSLGSFLAVAPIPALSPEGGGQPFQRNRHAALSRPPAQPPTL